MEYLAFLVIMGIGRLIGSVILEIKRIKCKRT